MATEAAPPDAPHCCISLSDVTDDPAVLDGCTHNFCLDCILAWAARESRCPVCRARFSTVVTATATHAVVKKDQTYVWDGVVTAEDVEDVEGIVCDICGSGARRRGAELQCSAGFLSALSFCAAQATGRTSCCCATASRPVATAHTRLASACRVSRPTTGAASPAREPLSAARGRDQGWQLRLTSRPLTVTEPPCQTGFRWSSALQRLRTWSTFSWSDRHPPTPLASAGGCSGSAPSRPAWTRKGCQRT